jgi:serine-type D-Ala-D-Ala endopeptidase (penicillin-binding protein 7)
MTRGIRRAALVAVIAGMALAGPVCGSEGPHLKSAAALIVDSETGEILFDKNAAAVVPIASITKLMTAMVVLDAGLPLDEEVRITEADVDVIKGTRSKLRVGSVLTRDELMKLALAASENRAASALGRSHPNGLRAFVAAMNEKARSLEMHDTRFADPTGLNSANVSSAADLAKLARAAAAYALIQEYSTLAAVEVEIGGCRIPFRNTNGLVRAGEWEIGLSKTGFINEAGRCLLMQAKMAARSVIIVLLDSWGAYTRIADANRIRQWLEPGYAPPPGAVKVAARAKAPRLMVKRTSTGRVKAQIKPPHR